MITAKKSYFILGSVFTVLSVIMLISNILLFSVHRNFHHKKEHHKHLSLKHDLPNFLTEKNGKCSYCELLIFSAKIFSFKKALNADFTIEAHCNLPEFKESFRSILHTSIKARSPPFSFFIQH